MKITFSLIFSHSRIEYISVLFFHAGALSVFPFDFYFFVLTVLVLFPNNVQRLSIIDTIGSRIGLAGPICSILGLWQTEPLWLFHKTPSTSPSSIDPPTLPSHGLPCISRSRVCWSAYKSEHNFICTLSWPFFTL